MEGLGQGEPGAMPQLGMTDARAASPAAGPACPECGTPYGAWPGAGMSPATVFAYAIGRVEPRFPSIGVEKEVAQAAGARESRGALDRELLSQVLEESENRYLADQLCWVFVAQGIDAFTLHWRDVADRDRLIDGIGAAEEPSAIDAVVGWVGSGPDAGICRSLGLPSVGIVQLLSFGREEFVSGVPAPKDMGEKEFRAAVGSVFDRIARRSDNTGQSDEHRALNYVALRYPALYGVAAEVFSKEMSLVTIDVRRIAAGGARRVVELRLIFRGRRDDVVEQYRCRVDVTEVFPFLISPLEPTFD